MDKKILFRVLQLDSIFQILDWKERIRIHLYLQEKAKTTTPQILTLYEWIDREDWKPPSVRYGQDRLLYYEKKEGDWRPIEDYQKKYTNQIIPIQ